MTDPLSGTLSDSLEDKITVETYGLFPLPVTKYTNPNHTQHKKDILEWMSSNTIVNPHGREAISHNISQIGPNNQLLLDLPHIAQQLITATRSHNDNAHKYNTKFGIQDSYLELADEQAIYAPHEHSNCLFSITYLVNYDPSKHAFIKWRRNVASNFYQVMQFDSTEPTPYNMTEATFNMVEGDIIIYPSNITHGFDNNSEGQRISLTANIVPIG